MLYYRDKTVEFHSNFDSNDVKAAEEILRDYGMDNTKVKKCLRDICRRMFDLKIYDD